MFGYLNETQIEEVIIENIVGRLGCSLEGNPYVIPISYAYDGVFIYCRSFDGLKITIMRKNPAVCFQVDTMKHMADWQSVIIRGTYEELKNEKDRNAALQKLEGRSFPPISSETVKFSKEWPFPSEDYSAVGGIVFRIHINEKTGRCETLARVEK